MDVLIVDLVGLRDRGDDEANRDSLLGRTVRGGPVVCALDVVRRSVSTVEERSGTCVVRPHELVMVTGVDRLIAACAASASIGIELRQVFDVDRGHDRIAT